MSRMDFNRPYGQVYGEPGVQWQQDGRYFRLDGSPCDGEPEAADAPSDAVAAPADDARMSDPKFLKAQLEVYGEPWKGVAAAKRFLDGRGNE